MWTPAEECDDGNKINNDGCTNCSIDVRKINFKIYYLLQRNLAFYQEFISYTNIYIINLYNYCPIDINYIWVGLFQLGAILLSILYNMLSQLWVLIQSFMNYNNGNKVKKLQ